MKKIFSLALCAAMLASALASCASDEGRLDPAITLTSSDARANAEWLDERLDEIPDDVVIGVGSDAAYGIDMSDFESDGYILREMDGEVLIFGASADGLDRAVRKYAKAAEAGATAELDEVYHEGYRIEKLTVAGRDISEYTIYYPSENNENMLFAVSELQRLVKKACGAELAAVEGAPSGAAIEFRFSDDKALKDDGYKYTVSENGIVFEGAVKRGCMYAVWRFLENECGWTGLIYGESYLLPTEHLDIPAGTERSETPAFGYLNMYRHYWGSYNNDKGTPTDVQNSYGTLTCTMHGLASFLDWLTPSDPQICYNDDEIYAEVEENVQAYIEGQLTAGRQIGVDFFGVDLGQTDSNSYCTCKTCRSVYKREGSNSGSVVLFANRIAEAMVDEGYEGLYYKIFAYAGSNVPPAEADPNEWIHVTFCTDFNCSNHKADGSECAQDYISAPSTAYPSNSNNEDYDRWLRGWCEKTDSVYVWFYALDQALLQYTTLYNMYDDFRHFYELGVDGIFYQCQFDGLGIQRVQHQMLAQLQWNMDMTEEEWESFLCCILESEFGDGWEYIREYIEIWERAQDMMPCWHCWGGGYYSMGRFSFNYVEANFDTCVELFDKAIHEANSAAQQSRAEALSCPMYYQGCMSSYYRAEARGDTERMQVISDRYAHMVELLHKNGFDPAGAGIYTVDGYREHYPLTVEECAADCWTNEKASILADLK